MSNRHDSVRAAKTVTPKFAPCGDAALTVEFAQAIDTDINACVLGLDAEIANAAIAGIQETVPTYGSLLVYYDPLVTSFATLRGELVALCAKAIAIRSTGAGWTIPVTYGGEFGFDLDAVAAFHGLDPQEVVRRHTAAPYRIFMIGFLPGFTYLGGLDPTLALPRRPVPRLKVPAGSIVIGGLQAAIGSIEGPSGWHVIGRTPVRLFMPERDPLVFVKPGDTIALRPISAAEHQALEHDAAGGALVAEPCP